MSPLGAKRMTRGPARPETTASTLKPCGTFGLASGFFAALSGKFATDSLGAGFGRSPGLMSLLTPGASSRQSPKAAFPVLIVCAENDWAGANVKARAAAEIKRTRDFIYAPYRQAGR